MADSPSLLLAFAAGFISFVSPCCLPLVPGYLATVGGGARAARGRGVDPAVLGRSVVFVATFSAIFMALGLTSTVLGQLLLTNRAVLEKVAGATIITMGLLFAASVFVTRLNVEWRPQRLLERAGRGGPAVVGAAFAIGWTPCVGPTLGAILGLAATQSGVGQGALLLGVYSAGLAVPFLLSAVAFDASQGALAVFRRHHVAVTVVSGVLLVAMGTLVFSGQLFQLNIRMRELLSGLGLDQLWGI